MIGRSTQLIRSRSFLPVTSMGCSAFCLRSSSSCLLPPSTLATSFLTKVPSWMSRRICSHPLLGVGVDDARTRQVSAELRGVGHRVVHPGDAALVHQVDDQLELVQHLEVGHLRRIARLDHHVETGLHQFLCATAQHGLLAEQVGLGLVLEGGLDDAGAGAADALGVGQRQRLALAGRVLVDGDQAGHALAVDELAAHQVAGALGGDHRRR